MADVKIARRLRWETSHNALRDVLKADVVVCVACVLGFRAAFRAAFRVGRGASSCSGRYDFRNPGIRFENEVVPACEIDAEGLLEGALGYAVAAEGTPNDKVGGCQVVVRDV